MLQSRRTGSPIDGSDARRGENGGDCNRSSIIPPRPISELEWKPFDLVQKRSGTHNLSRVGYSEDSKCCL